MATVTVTMTYGTQANQAGTGNFWDPVCTVAAGVGGAINSPNKQVTVRFLDSAAGTNTVLLVGTVEQVQNFAREILKAVSQN